MAILTHENKHLLRSFTLEHNGRNLEFQNLKFCALDKTPMMSSVLNLLDEIRRDDSQIDAKYRLLNNHIKSVEPRIREEIKSNVKDSAINEQIIDQKVANTIQEIEIEFLQNPHTNMEKLLRIIDGVWTLNQLYDPEEIAKIFDIESLKEIAKIFDSNLLNEKDILSILSQRYKEPKIYEDINSFIVKLLSNTWIESFIVIDERDADLILDSKESIDSLINDDLLFLSKIILNVIKINMKDGVANIVKNINKILDKPEDFIKKNETITIR